jgi:hypothetical protein
MGAKCGKRERREKFAHCHPLQLFFIERERDYSSLPTTSPFYCVRRMLDDDVFSNEQKYKSL